MGLIPITRHAEVITRKRCSIYQRLFSFAFFRGGEDTLQRGRGWGQPPYIYVMVNLVFIIWTASETFSLIFFFH